MKKALLFISALLLMAGCKGGNDAEGSTRDSTLINIAVIPTLDCLPLFLAEEHDMFNRHGLNIHLTDYQAQMDCDTAFVNNSAQGMITDLVRAERLKRLGTDLVYATATRTSWQLLTSQTARIKQLKQLDDRMLAMTRYSATDLLGDLLVDSAKLKHERVFRIQINDIDVRPNMLENHTMDAMFLPEPQATAARNLKANVLYDTRQHMHLGVLAIRKEKSDSTWLKHLEAAYNEAIDSINANGLKKYNELIMRRCHVNQTTIDSLPPYLNVYPHFMSPAESDIKLAQDWLTKKQQ